MRELDEDGSSNASRRLAPNGHTEAERSAALRDAAHDLLGALWAMVNEQCDYMRLNNLGDPEKQHNIKRARAAISKALAGVKSDNGAEGK